MLRALVLSSIVILLRSPGDGARCFIPPQKIDEYVRSPPEPSVRSTGITRLDELLLGIGCRWHLQRPVKSHRQRYQEAYSFPKVRCGELIHRSDLILSERNSCHHHTVISGHAGHLVGRCCFRARHRNPAQGKMSPVYWRRRATRPFWDLTAARLPVSKLKLRPLRNGGNFLRHRGEFLRRSIRKLLIFNEERRRSESRES